MMERYLRRQSAVLGIVAASAIVVLMLATVIDVTVRAVTRASVPGMLELAETALVVSVFLGLAWTSMQGGHVSVTILTDRLGPRAGRVVASAMWIVSTFLVAWMLVATTGRAAESTAMHESRFGLVQWPLWPMRWVIVIGFACWLLVSVQNTVLALRGRPAHGDDADETALS